MKGILQLMSWWQRPIISSATSDCYSETLSIIIDQSNKYSHLMWFFFLQSQTMIKKSASEWSDYPYSQIDFHSNVIFVFPCPLNMFHVQIDFQREYYSTGFIATSEPREINVRCGINSRPWLYVTERLGLDSNAGHTT